MRKLNKKAFIILWGSFTFSVALQASPLPPQAAQQAGAKQLVSNPTEYIEYVFKTQYAKTVNDIRSVMDEINRIASAGDSAINIFNFQSQQQDQILRTKYDINMATTQGWLKITQQAQAITDRFINNFRTPSEPYKLLASTAMLCSKTAQELFSAVKAARDFIDNQYAWENFRSTVDNHAKLSRLLAQNRDDLASYLEAQKNKQSKLVTEIDQITHRKGWHAVYATTEGRVNAQYKAMNEAIKTRLLISILTLYSQILKHSLHATLIVKSTY